MDTAVEDTTWAELIHQFIDARLLDLHVSLPARVESYNASAQTVDVTIMVNKMVPDGATPPGYVSEPLPKLADVQVGHPRGGGMFVAIPLQQGDTGFLVFCESNIAAWRATGNQSDPGDLGRHTLSSPWFMPCGAPDSKALGNADGTNLVIGSDTNAAARIVIKPSGEIDAGATASNFVAMANKAKTWLDAFVGAVSGWTPVSQDGGAALKTALTTANIIGPGAISTDWSSSNLKAED